MRLFDLATSSYLCSQVIDFDKSFLAFRRAVENSPDLSRPDHRTDLLVWLNKWGCRQFARGHHDIASQHFAEWWDDCNETLPSSDAELWDVADDELQSVSDAYGKLVGKIASYRKASPVQVGPTGAAKTLFALRPRSLLPWDDGIRKRLKHDGSSGSYLGFLRDIRDICPKLDVECKRHGFALAELPARLNRPEATLPKLIDEYHYITMTRDVRLPSAKLVAEWLGWSAGG